MPTCCGCCVDTSYLLGLQRNATWKEHGKWMRVQQERLYRSHEQHIAWIINTPNPWGSYLTSEGDRPYGKEVHREEDRPVECSVETPVPRAKAWTLTWKVEVE